MPEQLITITRIKRKFFKSKFWFIKTVFEAISRIFKYKRFILITSNLTNNQKYFEVQIYYGGLNEKGVVRLLKEFVIHELLEEKGQEILEEVQKILEDKSRGQL